VKVLGKRVTFTILVAGENSSSQIMMLSAHKLVERAENLAVAGLKIDDEPD
jgi:hypothetical protein